MNSLFSGPNSFLWLGLLVGMGASVAFGSLGTIVVVKRLGYLTGAVAHASLGSIGVCLYAERVLGWSWVDPLLGGALLSMIAGLLMESIRRVSPEREDTLLGALWAVGMSVGLICLSQTPGYANPSSYLFGNLLLVSATDLWRILILDVILVVLIVAYYPVWQASAFDEEFARLRGVKVALFSALFIALVSLSVVLLLSVVGLLLVVALMTLPASAAGRVTKSLAGMMIGGSAICAVCVASGLGLSYLTDWPSGPSIVILTAGVYFGFAQFGRLHNRRRA